MLYYFRIYIILLSISTYHILQKGLFMIIVCQITRKARASGKWLWGKNIFFIFVKAAAICFKGRQTNQKHFPGKSSFLSCKSTVKIVFVILKKSVKKISQLAYCPSLQLMIVCNFTEFHFEMTLPADDRFLLCFFSCLTRRCVPIFVLTRILVKTVPRKFYVAYAKNFWRFGKRSEQFINIVGSCMLTYKKGFFSNNVAGICFLGLIISKNTLISSSFFLKYVVTSRHILYKSPKCL